MVDDILLTEETFQVLKRLPAEWWEYGAAVDGISSAMGISEAKVRGSIEHLRRRHLVERRARNTIHPTVEIRKIGR